MVGANTLKYLRIPIIQITVRAFRTPISIGFDPVITHEWEWGLAFTHEPQIDELHATKATLVHLYGPR